VQAAEIRNQPHRRVAVAAAAAAPGLRSLLSTEDIAQIEKSAAKNSALGYTLPDAPAPFLRAQET